MGNFLCERFIKLYRKQHFSFYLHPAGVDRYFSIYSIIWFVLIQDTSTWNLRQPNDTPYCIERFTLMQRVKGTVHNVILSIFLYIFGKMHLLCKFTTSLFVRQRNRPLDPWIWHMKLKDRREISSLLSLYFTVYLQSFLSIASRNALS